MKKVLVGAGALIALSVIVSGCANPILSPIEQKWHAQKLRDDFTGSETCRITTWYGGDGYATLFRRTNELYPVVEWKDYNLMVGLMTAPMQVGNQQIASPSGDVQIKIDDNEPWTIAALETPIQVVPGSSSQIMTQRMEEMTKRAWSNVPGGPSGYSTELPTATQLSGMMSSMTLASGAKAQNIFAQMKSGRQIKYRNLPGGMVSTQTQQFSLEGFNDAAAVCGL